MIPQLRGTPKEGASEAGRCQAKRRWHQDRAGKGEVDRGRRQVVDAASLPQRRLRRGLRGTHLFEVGHERRHGLGAGLLRWSDARDMEQGFALVDEQ